MPVFSLLQDLGNASLKACFSYEAGQLVSWSAAILCMPWNGDRCNQKVHEDCLENKAKAEASPGMH